MKIGIIDNIGFNYDKYLNDESYGLGGSETWTVQISKYLSHKKIDVYVYCCIDKFVIDTNNVKYFPINEFNENNNLQKFDIIIITRSLCDTLEIIKNTKCCNNVYLMTHEPAIFDNYWEINYNIYNDKLSKYLFLLKKILVLSDFCKDVFKSQYNIPEHLMELTANGFDFDLFPTVNNEQKDHSMLWSTEFNRGFDEFIDNIVPLIIEKIPDFTIYACSHIGELDDKYNNYKFIKYLGKLDKITLYKEMNKHACFFYANKCWEAFCNTAVEAALSDNDLIMPLREGPETVFKPFKQYFMDEGIYFAHDYEFHLAANLISDSILNHDNPEKIKLRNEIKTYIKEKYNWPYIVENLLILFKNNK